MLPRMQRSLFDKVGEVSQGSTQLGGGALDPFRGRPAQDVAAADHDPDRRAQRPGGDQIGGEPIERGGVDAERLRPAQRLA